MAHRESFMANPFNTDKTPSTGPALPVRRAVLALFIGVAALAAIIAGCGGRKADPAYCAAPAPGSSHQVEEKAYWRQRYLNNRPDAPEIYQVFPKHRPDNSFGEFDDQRHQGLDVQPALPRLPADASAPFPPPRNMMAGGSLPQSTLLPATAVGALMPRLAPAGLNTGGHFYPVEQLVYGGDYADIDKPQLYRLMPKDVITITVKDHPEFAGTLEIQADGTVRIPNAPDLVRVRGLTVEEAANAIKITIAPYIKGECLVRVQANRARGGYYFVFGDVLQPGRFPMGMEPLKLSEAVLAANWEANPARRDLDGDELGPSFPAASPRGRYIAPPSADLAGVMLITPHRSQPVRTRHDVRAAMLGSTADDPLLRPGQIIVVPSLIAARNRELGLDSLAGTATAAVPTPALSPGQGFAGANSPARLPETQPAPAPVEYAAPYSAVETNMTGAYDTSLNSSGPLYR